MISDFQFRLVLCQPGGGARLPRALARSFHTAVDGCGGKIPSQAAPIRGIGALGIEGGGLAKRFLALLLQRVGQRLQPLRLGLRLLLLDA